MEIKKSKQHSLPREVREVREVQEVREVRELREVQEVREVRQQQDKKQVGAMVGNKETSPTAARATASASVALAPDAAAVDTAPRSPAAATLSSSAVTFAPHTAPLTASSPPPPPPPLPPKPLLSLPSLVPARHTNSADFEAAASSEPALELAVEPELAPSTSTGGAVRQVGHNAYVSSRSCGQSSPAYLCHQCHYTATGPAPIPPRFRPDSAPIPPRFHPVSPSSRPTFIQANQHPGQPTFRPTHKIHSSASAFGQYGMTEKDRYTIVCPL
jgi:hypothetical protein